MDAQVLLLLSVFGLVCLSVRVSAQTPAVDTTSTTTPTSISDPVLKACLTARDVSGVCVQRNSCDYGTGAIDMTLFAPHGYKRPCEMAEVCCPHAAIVHSESPGPVDTESYDDDEDFD